MYNLKTIYTNNNIGVVNLKDTNKKGKKWAEMVDNNTLNNSGNVNDMSYASGITNSEHSIDANTITIFWPYSYAKNRIKMRMWQ